MKIYRVCFERVKLEKERHTEFLTEGVLGEIEDSFNKSKYMFIICIIPRGATNLTFFLEITQPYFFINLINILGTGIFIIGLITWFKSLKTSLNRI